MIASCALRLLASAGITDGSPNGTRGFLVPSFGLSNVRNVSFRARHDGSAQPLHWRRVDRPGGGLWILLSVRSPDDQDRNETYSDGFSGYLRYLGNRALRIYPAYYVAAAFAAGVLLLWPVAAQTAAGWYMFPEGWLQSITIIGLQPRSPILVVPAWSLHVELIYYVLIGAILGRFRLLTVLWFVFALATPVVVLLLRGFSFEWLYLLALWVVDCLRHRGNDLSVSRKAAGHLANSGDHSLLCAHFSRPEDVGVVRGRRRHASFNHRYGRSHRRAQGYGDAALGFCARRFGLSGLPDAHPLSCRNVRSARTLQCLDRPGGNRDNHRALVPDRCPCRAAFVPDPREAAITQIRRKQMDHGMAAKLKVFARESAGGLS